MSATFKVQSGNGRVIEKEPDGAVLVVLASAPTNSQAGFAKGCLWINTAGAVGTLVYVNTGTTSSTTWTNIA